MKKITNAGTIRDGRGRMSVNISSVPKRKKSTPAVISAAYDKDGEVALTHSKPKK